MRQGTTVSKLARLGVVLAGIALAASLAVPPIALGQSCGDGVVDVGEECDPGPQVDDTCCTAACTFRAAGTVCRESSAGAVCDIPEECTGSSGECPPDAKLTPADGPCRPSAGLCDFPEFCDGFSDFCPADAKAFRGAVCRAAAGACDQQEVCDGQSNDCPVDEKRAAGTVCRAAGLFSPCDIAEECDGTTDACPPDAVKPNGELCRAAAGDCDEADFCDGVSTACPNARVAQGTECRGSAGPCDPAEVCSGFSPNCPADRLLSGAVCREAQGECDVAERCSGVSPDCPADEKEPTTTSCRAPTGPCDAEDFCDGQNDLCPPDGIQPAGAVCREPAGLCDIPETCNGLSKNCPFDQREPAGKVCRPVPTPDPLCDVAEVCNGFSPLCPDDGFKPFGETCRPAAGDCDLAEICTGLTNTCPADRKRANGAVCGIAVGACDDADLCNGVTNDCPDIKQPAGTVCREADPTNVCDLADTCNGTTNGCPNTGLADGTPCADALFCNGEETCRSARCVAPALPPCLGAECDEAADECIVCGDGVPNLGEECAEPGLPPCDVGLLCDRCLCVPEGPELLVTPVCAPLGSDVQAAVRLNTNAALVSALSFRLSYPFELSIGSPLFDVQCAQGALGFTCTSAVNNTFGFVDVVVAPPIPPVGDPLAILPDGVTVVNINFTVDEGLVNTGPSPVCSLDPAECMPLSLSNLSFSDDQGNEILGGLAVDGCADVLECVQGDCNGDTNVTTADVTCDIRRLLNADAQRSPCEDCNGDGNLSSADVTCTILCLFGACPA